MFILTMVCLFVYTVKHRGAKQVPSRTVQDAKPAPSVATNDPSPEPVPSAPEERVARLNRHGSDRKRAVNSDMVEIVMTMAPHVPQEKSCKISGTQGPLSTQWKISSLATRLGFLMYRIKYIKNHKSTGVGCMRLFLLSLLLQGIFFTGSMFTIPPASRWFLSRYRALVSV